MLNKRKESSSKMEGSTLFVQGLPLMLDSSGLRSFFSKFGPVASSTRVIRHQGYGFVEFENPECAEAALTAACGSNPLRIDGLSIKVEKAKAADAGEVTSGTGGSLTTSRTSDYGSTSNSPGSRSPLRDQTAAPRNASNHTPHAAKPQIATRNTSKTSLGESSQRAVRAAAAAVNTTTMPVVVSPSTVSPLVYEKQKPLLQEKRCVKVMELPPQATKVDVFQVFSVFGRIHAVTMMMNGEPIVKKNAEGGDDDDENITAVSVWSIRVRYDTTESANRAFEACKAEGIPVTRYYSSSSGLSGLNVGSYAVAPNFLDSIDSLSAFGTITSLELALSHTGCIIAYDEVETPVQNLLTTPVFLRGIQLKIDLCS